MKQLSLSSSSLRAVGATLVAGLAALSATAQNDALPPAPAEPIQPPYVSADVTLTPNRQTEKFITDVSMLSSEKTRLSEVAAQRAASEQVRTFAEYVRTSSEALEQDLDQLARSKNVLLPTGRAANDLAENDEQWQKKEGRDFDEDFVKRVIDVQRDSIDALEDYTEDNEADPELAAFAHKHLPALRENLSQAESLRKQID